MFTDDTLLTFGKYKFVRLCRVPPEYLLNLYENRSQSAREVLLTASQQQGKELMDYIVANLEKIQARQRGEIEAPELELVCEKVQYPTQKAAKAELKRIAAREQQHRKPTRTYECGKCGAWHLTSMPMERWEMLHEDKK